MRVIALWLVGLIAASSAHAAPLAPQPSDDFSLLVPAGQRNGPQSGTPGGGWNVPHRNPSGGNWTGPQINPGCPKGTIGKWPICISVKAPKCPKNTKGKWPDCQEVVRFCPEGTIGKWPNCTAKSTASCADKGLVGKWPKCRKPDEPDIAVKPCPDGQVRKGNRCVELTTDEGGKKVPPRVEQAQKQEEISPAVAALVDNRPHRPKEILVLVDAARASEIAARLARQYNVIADPRLVIPLLDWIRCSSGSSRRRRRRA